MIEIARIERKDRDELFKLFQTVIADNLGLEHALGEQKMELKEIVDAIVSEQTLVVDSDVETNGNENFYFVAKDGHHIIGTLAYGDASTTLLEVLPRSKAIKSIKSAFVLPSYQGKGGGTLLLRHILLEMKRKNIEEFALYTGFKTGLSFWTKRLGQPVACIEDYFGSGVHCWAWQERVKAVLEVS